MVTPAAISVLSSTAVIPVAGIIVDDVFFMVNDCGFPTMIGTPDVVGLHIIFAAKINGAPITEIPAAVASTETNADV